MSCPICRRVTIAAPMAGRTCCPRCDTNFPARHPHSLARATAFGISAVALLLPAYTLPVMSLERLGHAHSDTIFSSVAKLWHSGLWGIALIIFTASLLVPALKLLGLGLLIAAARRPGLASPVLLTRLHAIVHGVGRWSMLDIFLVAFLCGIVQFDGLATIEARPGVLAFAGAVILTMLATASFDSRLLWDRTHPNPE